MAIVAPADRRWIPFRVILGLAIGAAVGLAAAAIFWETGLIRGETVAAWQDEFVAAQTGPGLVLAMALALVIGASMVVLPCGFPSVFAVPSLLQRADTTSRPLPGTSGLHRGRCPATCHGWGGPGPHRSGPVGGA